MKELTFASQRSRKLGIALLAASVWALSATGCLLASGRPVLDFGEECKSSADCASFGFCAATLSDGALCLPQTAECTRVDDPICGGYACVLHYAAAYAYCERKCQSTSDCATGRGCTDFDSHGDGVCK
jgi:hypothetical protein